LKRNGLHRCGSGSERENAKKYEQVFADLKNNPILTAFKTRGILLHALRKKEKTP